MSFYLLVLTAAICRGEVETVAVCSGEVRSFWCWQKPSSSSIHPPLLGRHFTPELCLRSCSSLLKQPLPSLFSILVSICLFISLPLSLATQPLFFFLLQANRSIAKNSSVGLLRIYICKWEPMLLVNLQLSKQLKLTNNVGPYYFTNNRVSCALIYIANPITFFLLPLCNWLKIMSWTILKVFD